MIGWRLVRAQVKSSAGWLMVPVMIGFAVFDAFGGEGLVWRYEWQRTVNGAGGYFLAVGPLLVGIGCLEATRARRAAAGIRDGLRHPSDATWPAVASLILIVVATHAAVLITRAVLAVASGAIGYPWWHAPFVQLLLVSGLCAIGALIGQRTDAILAGPMVATAGLFIVMSTTVPLVRTVLLAGGGGYFDQSFVGAPAAWTAAVAVALVAALALAWPGRLRPREPVQRGGAAVAGLAGLAGVIVLPSSLVIANEEMSECVEEEVVTVCGPRGTESLLGPVSEQLVAAAAALDQVGAELPSREYRLGLRLEAPEIGSPVSVPVTVSIARDEEQLREELLPYMTGSIFCPGYWSEYGPTTEEDSAAVIAATWLRDELGGEAPSGEVSENGAVDGLLGADPSRLDAVADIFAAFPECDQNELRHALNAS